MNSATCSVLAGVFPIVLLTLVLERRAITINLRKRRWVRQIIIGGVATSLAGEGVALAGVQVNGYPLTQAIVAWTVTAVALLCFAMSLLMIVATDEIEEEADAEG
ncbi:MAG TPA: hypothetical protein VGM94_17440 [Galbitalea sp.]